MGVANLDPRSFYSFAKMHQVIIDLREEVDFPINAIPGSLQLNIKPHEVESTFGDVDKSMPLYLYCSNGIKSKIIAGILAENGFDKIYRLRGGFNAWKRSLKVK